jgi:hypothetical protein
MIYEFYNPTQNDFVMITGSTSVDIVDRVKGRKVVIEVDDYNDVLNLDEGAFFFRPGTYSSIKEIEDLSLGFFMHVTTKNPDTRTIECIEHYSKSKMQRFLIDYSKKSISRTFTQAMVAHLTSSDATSAGMTVTYTAASDAARTYTYNSNGSEAFINEKTNDEFLQYFDDKNVIVELNTVQEVDGTPTPQFTLNYLVYDLEASPLVEINPHLYKKYNIEYETTPYSNAFNRVQLINTDTVTVNADGTLSGSQYRNYSRDGTFGDTTPSQPIYQAINIGDNVTFPDTTTSYDNVAKGVISTMDSFSSIGYEFELIPIEVFNRVNLYHQESDTFSIIKVSGHDFINKRTIVSSTNQLEINY